MINEQKLTKNNINSLCEECCAKIPPSNGRGMSIEVDEYVHYFCGQECYKKWKNRTDCCLDNK